MKINDLAQLEGVEALSIPAPDGEITAAYTSDLLSDVMAHAEADSVLITIQAHKNTVAVALLAGCTAILLCNNRPVPDDMVAAAADEDIAVLRCSCNQFQASLRVGKALGL